MVFAHRANSIGQGTDKRRRFRRTIRSMSNGRSPGKDGITKDVCKVVFSVSGNHYVRMLKMNGTPDDGLIKNERSLSLMNIDDKILSKVLNNQLRKAIVHIINEDQTCSIPSRSIRDNIHLIRSLNEYHARRKEPIGTYCLQFKRSDSAGSWSSG